MAQLRVMNENEFVASIKTDHAAGVPANLLIDRVMGHRGWSWDQAADWLSYLTYGPDTLDDETPSSADTYRHLLEGERERHTAMVETYLADRGPVMGQLGQSSGGFQRS
jgi:hypothetical protein